MPATLLRPFRRSPRPALVAACCVLLAHGLLLSGLPLQLGASTVPERLPALHFEMRPLEEAPPPAAAVPVTAPVRPRPAGVRPVQRPSQAAAQVSTSTSEFIQNSPQEPVDIAQAAPEKIATPAPLPLPPSEPAAPAKAPVKPPLLRYSAPGSARLLYDIQGQVKGFPVSLQGELTWVQEGSHYSARMGVSHFLLGTRVQTSVGEITPQGLEPRRFGDKVRSEVAAHFERDKGKISFSANTPDVPLEEGAQDQLSVILQLAALAAGTPQSMAEGAQLHFLAVGPRSAENWVFTVAGMETLTLPGGALPALKLARAPAVDMGNRAEVWLAPSLGYLPVRIRITEGNGDVLDQQWRATEKP